MKKLLLTAFALLFVTALFAQGKYTKAKLIQLPLLEFNEYDWKAQKLQKNGEKLAIYGGIAGLAGMGIGALNGDGFSSSDGSDLVNGLAATLLIGGIVATGIGIPMFIVGIVRCTRINEVRLLRDDRVQLEWGPQKMYCRPIGTHCTGFTVRLSF